MHGEQAMAININNPQPPADPEAEALSILRTLPDPIKKKSKRELFEEKHNVLNLSDVVEKDIEWLIPGWIPKNTITFLAGDGGIGKTTLWCDVVAAISKGKPCILDSGDVNRSPAEVLYFSSEDAADTVLHKKLRYRSADMRKIHTIEVTDEEFPNIVFLPGGLLEEMIDVYRPALCVFDPIQQFLPEGVDMAKRNEVRRCTSVLHTIGEKYGCTFLITMHTNKSNNSSARNKLADSADIWDIARSVIMQGETGQGNLRFISQEKSNYGMQQKTVLYRTGSEGLIYSGTTEKRYRDFQNENSRHRAPSPQSIEAKEFIIMTLAEHPEGIATGELLEMAKANGITPNAFTQAKGKLLDNKEIRQDKVGNGKGKGVTFKLYPLTPRLENA